MDNTLMLDAKTAAELDCKPGDTKTLQVTVSITENDDKGLVATVESVEHYDETADKPNAGTDTASPSTEKAVNQLMT